MISENEALERILATAKPIGSERRRLADCLGLHAAQTFFASIPIPRFDQSAMDGFAVAEPLAAGATLVVAGEQPAGVSRNLTVLPGHAIRIFTGAPLPRGTQCVLMQEDAEENAGSLKLLAPVERDENIRRSGADLAAGQKIIENGEWLTPRSLALLSSQGATAFDVGRIPCVAVLTTGNELREPGTDLEPGCIFNSNGVMLAAQLEAHGFPASDRTHVPDDREALIRALQNRREHDAVIVSGGASVGKYDLLRDCLAACGAQIHFWRVAIKPGKPLIYATLYDTLVFGLPGNPVSAFVTNELFVVPALRRLAAASPQAAMPQLIPIPSATELRNPGHRTLYLRGRLLHGAFVPEGLQESHGLAALANATALGRVPPETTIPCQHPLDCLLLDA